MASNYHVVQISKARLNPYVRLLREALRGVGISCSEANGLSPSLVRSWQGKVDILHLHWLELLYASPTFARSVRLLATALAGLVLAKAKGYKIIYTVHNLSPHEQRFPSLNRFANLVLLALVDALHVHDEHTRLDLAHAYPIALGGRGRQRERIYVVPHGSYIGAYPNYCTKEEARAWLGLDNYAFVYLFLGQVRRYKGLEDLITAFSQLADGVCQLVIAGHVPDAAYTKTLVQLIHGQARVHTWFKYVPDEEVQYFMNACDVCVLPYRDVTTSGAAVLAFSFGKPVIAPALGGFPELIASGRGILYDPEEADGLLHALQKACLTDMENAGHQALAWAKEHEWHTLAPCFVRIYADVQESRRSK